MITIQKIVVHFLVFAFLFGIVKNTVITSVYNYDQELFISLFCENTDKPEMHCDGKCAMAKMQKEQKEDDAHKTLSKLQVETIALVQAFNFEACYSFFTSEESIHLLPTYSNNYSFEYADLTAKPPTSF